MKKLFYSILLALTLTTNAAFVLDNNKVEKIADAIYLTEGGKSATYLYGIRSVKYKDETESRQICKNSVVNNYQRWLGSGHADGKPVSFVQFMAARYSPYDQQVWSKNVLYFWKKFDKTF